jgi:hypothetical protein
VIVIILIIVMLIAVMVIVIMLIVIMLIVSILIVIMLIVIILNVVAPKYNLGSCSTHFVGGNFPKLPLSPNSNICGQEKQPFYQRNTLDNTI